MEGKQPQERSKAGGGCFGRKIKWKFTKFLVSRDGSVIKRYAPATTPMKIEKDIVEMLQAEKPL